MYRSFEISGYALIIVVVNVGICVLLLIIFCIYRKFKADKGKKN